LTNKAQLLNVAFQVYDNCDLEEERREQNKERRQAKLVATMIGLGVLVRSIRHPQAERPKSHLPSNARSQVI
jgi:hypothetical protein